MRIPEGIVWRKIWLYGGMWERQPLTPIVTYRLFEERDFIHETKIIIIKRRGERRCVKNKTAIS